MSMYFDIAARQVIGARKHQEDAFLVSRLDETVDGAATASAVVSVADGMGGHAAGDVASDIAVRIFNKSVSERFPPPVVTDTLRESLNLANSAIQAAVREKPTRQGMGCTLVSVLLDSGQMWWMSVGDSHLYLYRGGQLIKKNADHSYGAYLDMMAASGKEIPQEAAQFPRNMLLSALTGGDIEETDLALLPLQVHFKDRILLASDGVNTLTAEEIAHICAQSKSAEECAARLLDAVERAGAPEQDNATVVVVDALEKGESRAAFESTFADLDGGQAVGPGGYAAVDGAPDPEVGAPRGGAKAMIAAAVVGVLAVAGAAGWLLLGNRGNGGAELAEIQRPRVGEGSLDLPRFDDEETEPAETSGSGGPKQPAPSAQQPSEAGLSQGAEERTPPPVVRTFRDSLRSGAEGPVMTEIPRGMFRMGSPSSTPNFEERPQHAVKFGTFAIGRYEVTVKQYRAFARATGRKMPPKSSTARDDYPIANVSWKDAVAYAQWLSRQTGHKYRLPSESEWEYAAGAGFGTTYWWGREVGENHAQCFDCNSALGRGHPAPVGSFAPGPFGTYDTAGNVMEWVQDCYHKDYEGAPTDGSAWEEPPCHRRVVRGGSYNTPAGSLRVARRDKFYSDTTLNDIGFRVARDL